ncbi:hypothetical protein PsYK624_011570 [Phanerochaete sordida]|uniref:DUF6533 domain-containing protein n=1 Tax=Phanerochaete sordida TaxID=48140 RepID=A0A9P3FZN6_9APHY|nr:hypothetical protein PsYK624_011570 [Phanerochaete sordida]
MPDPTEDYDLLNASYVQTAVTALVVYEHIITLSSEITMVWRRRPTVSAALFLSIRYCLLLQAAIPHVGAGAESCNVLMKLSEALAIVGMLQVAIFSALRTSVLFPRLNYIIFAVVFVLGAVPVATLSFVLAHSHAVLLGPPLDICQHVNEFPHKIARK